MMQSFRRNTRIVLFVVVIAFVLLIFFEWGMNVTGIRQNPETDIVKIDGKPVSYTEYLQFVQMKETERRDISREQIWNMMIDEVIWNNLIRKEQIKVSDDEIWTLIRNNPPQSIYESEYMKNEQGEFDFNKYYELLRSPQSREWLVEYEYNLRRELPKQKLRSLIMTFGWISTFEDSMLIARETSIYDISMLSMPVFRMRGKVEITDAILGEYYDKNKKDFTTPESKILKYVYFDRKPSNQDTLEARERLEDFIIRIKEGEDFLTVAREVTDDTIVQYGASAGTSFLPYMTSVYKNLKNNEVSGIFEGSGCFEVIKKVGKDSLYRVKAGIEVSPTTIGEINDLIESFKDVVKNGEFDSAAQEFNLTVRKTYPLTAEKVNFPVRNPDELAKYLSQVSKKNDIGGPFSSVGGYYLFALDSVIPEKVIDIASNRPVIQARYERENLRDVMSGYLNDTYKELQAGKTLEQIAAADTFYFFQNDIRGSNIVQIESRYGQEVAGAVAQLEMGQVSAPLSTEWAGYIIRCDRKVVMPMDSTLVNQLQVARQVRLQYLSQAIFTPKKIIDNRDKFFE